MALASCSIWVNSHGFEVLLGVGDRLGDVAKLIAGLEQHLVAEIPFGEPVKQTHQIVHLFDHQARAGHQQYHKQQPHDGGLHQAAPEQAVGDGIRLGRV